MTRFLLSKTEAFILFATVTILVAIGGALFSAKSAHAQAQDVVMTPCGPLMTSGYALNRGEWDFFALTNPTCARFQQEAQEAINVYGIAGLWGTVKRWNGGQIIVTPVLPPPPVVLYQPQPPVVVYQQPTITGFIVFGSNHGHRHGGRHRH